MGTSNEKITAIKEYLFGTPDRLITFISIIVTLASIILTIFLWSFPEKVPQLIILRDIVVLFSLIFMSALLLYKYTRRELHLNTLNNGLKLSNTRLNKQFSNFHSIVHKFRNDLFQHYIDRIPNEIVVSDKEKIVFEKICHSITVEVKKIMKEYLESKEIKLEDDLCVTVKLTLTSKNILDLYGLSFDQDIRKKLKKNRSWVITVYRDPETYEKHREKRDVGGRIYSVEKNTAFALIFNDKEQIFAKDNLQALGDTYKNENPHWKEQYNSTIVAPIRFYITAKSGYRCFGFIAIDSMNRKNEQLFENEEAKYIIGHAADLMANFFLTLSIARTTACLPSENHPT